MINFTVHLIFLVQKTDLVGTIELIHYILASLCCRYSSCVQGLAHFITGGFFVFVIIIGCCDNGGDNRLPKDISDATNHKAKLNGDIVNHNIHGRPNFEGSKQHPS